MWAGQDAIAPSGLTVFQEQCEAALRGYLSSRDVQSRNRQAIQGANEKWIEGFVGDTGARIFIYEDQVELSAAGKSLNLERWDARLPRTSTDLQHSPLKLSTPKGDPRRSASFRGYHFCGGEPSRQGSASPEFRTFP